MKEQRYCLRLLLQRCILCCVIFSVLFSSLAFESEAAATNVVEDVNKDGQITLDEVDSSQLATYGLLIGYGVTGSNVTGSIMNSSAYTSALAEVAGSENTIIVGTVADGKVSFGEWFRNLCANVYAELTGADVIGYFVIPSYSKDYFIQWMNESKDAGVIYDSEYTEFYNAVMSTDYTGCFFYRELDSQKGRIYYNVTTSGYDFVLSPSTSSTYLDYIVLGDSISSSRYSTSYDWITGSGFATGYSGKLLYPVSDNLVLGCIGSSLIVFNSTADYTRFVNLTNQICFSSSVNSLDDVSFVYLNTNDWSAVSGNVYNAISTAVMDANNATANQIQNIIDTQMEDLSEFIEEDNAEGEDPEGGNEGSEGSGTDNSELSDKLEQNNQLQQESNQLQEENNQLQEENNALQEEQNETSKGILGKITEFFGGFFENLKNAVVGIFVPDQETMQGNFERLDQFFSDTFGFLYYPFDFLIEAVNIFLSADSGTSLTFPGFSIMGYEVWSDQSFDLTSIDVVNTIFETVRLVTGGVLAFAFINYLRSFFDKRFGGGGA